MRLISFTVFSTLAFVISGCSTPIHNEAQTAPATREPSSASASWRVEVEVNGDANCDSARKPVPYAVVLSSKTEKLEFISSFSVPSPSAFLKKPFRPTVDEKAFLTKASKDFVFLKTNLKDYTRISEKLFAEAFGNDFHLSSQVQVLENLGVFSHQFTHHFRVDRLPEFQDWYFKVVPDAVKQNKGLMARRDHDGKTVILPLLIFGEVSRQGSAPNYVIQFNPDKTSINTGAQNEANDTTLCQLQTGIFDVTRHPTADIGISRVIRVTKEN